MADLEYCEYMTGLPYQFYTLLVGVETHNGNYIQFYTDGTVHVDWVGDGHYLVYPPGIVYGKQENPGVGIPIIIRSTEIVTTLRFGSTELYDREYKEINIVKATDLLDATRLCYRLEELQVFKFFGNNQIESYESAWEDCTELLKFEGMDTTRAITLKKAWKNCNKLTTFPNVYAKECLTVEEAWMGCTAMKEFPMIDVSNCLNFKSAWRGNENLHYFPYLDTKSGVNFDHAWAYCTDLTYFPALNFEKALNMDFTFAYMKGIRNMPIINAKLSKSFRSTFQQMCSLRCIAGIDTRSLESRDDSWKMFDKTYSLLSPGETDRYQIEGGALFPEPNTETVACYYDAGRSIFFVHTEPLLNYCSEISFTITGGDFEIDWGDNVYLHYNEGTISNIPIGNNGVNIRSEENITSIVFNTDTFTSIEFKRARTLTSMHYDDNTYPNDRRGMCEDLKVLKYFEILGPTRATDYTRMLSGCTNLEIVGEIDLAHVVELNGLFRGCKKLEHVGLRYYIPETDTYIYDNLDMPLAENFDEMFYGCESIKKIQSCLTPNGKSFIRMFANTPMLECIEAVNTTGVTESGKTTDMFDDISYTLVRPTAGERTIITNAPPGYDYNNHGNCGGPVGIIFTANGETSFQLDGEVNVDWGDGNIITYPANTLITGTPVGTGFCTIFGKGTTIEWTTDTLLDVVFVSVDNFTSMVDMFKGKTNLENFMFPANSFIEDYSGAFMDSGIMSFDAPDSFEFGISYTDMFRNTSRLNWVTNMDTYNGKDFEGMFQDSGLVCLQEINTSVAEFPPSMLDCTLLLDCSTSIRCFESTTMFLNASPTYPTAEEITEITYRSHWIGTSTCKPRN